MLQTPCVGLERPLENHINVALALPGVTIQRQEESTSVLRVVLVPSVLSAVCPVCGHTTGKVHDSRARVKADVPLGSQSLSLVMVRRRFACYHCPRTFTPDDPICGPRRRLTRRLRDQLGEQSVHQTVQRVALTYGVSPTTVRRAQAEYADQQTASEAPLTQIGIDEFSLRKGRRYATGLHDLTRRRLFDVIDGRTSAVVQAALNRLPSPEAIEVVSMDMAGTFRAAVQEVLPRAVIVADKFHVIARITDAVREVWKRLVRGKGRDDPLRRDGRFVLRGREHLGADQERRLWTLLHHYPALRRAWLLKEDFRRWYRTVSATAARLELRAWRRTIADLAHIPEIQALDGMLALWQEEILNYFTYRVTQGPVEGNNNRAKVIQRRAYGYRNFANYRRRLLLAG